MFLDHRDFFQTFQVAPTGLTGPEGQVFWKDIKKYFHDSGVSRRTGFLYYLPFPMALFLDFFPTIFAFAPPASIEARAAANLAMGTLYGEQLT